MARGGKKGGGAPGVTIVRRDEITEGGHHGGAWKVAYADFVTAMMAFFLLMWLLNATTEKQRHGIAEYFSPTDVLGRSATGSGQPFGGHTPFDAGSMVSDKGAVSVITGPNQPIDAEDDPEIDTPAAPRPHRRDTPTNEPDAARDQAAPTVTGDQRPVPNPSAARTKPEARQGAGSNLLAPNVLGPNALVQPEPGQTPGAGSGVQGPEQGPAPSDGTKPRPPSDAEFRAEAERQEKQALEKAAQEIRDAVRADPKLADVAKQLSIDMTPQGLRIQLMDEDRQPMFASGSATPNERARELLQKIAPVLMRLPEPLSVAGHTDAAPFPGPDRTNWELSAERANATRRMLTEAGLPDARIRSVTGNADRDPLLPSDPLAAANRRIAIVVLRTATVPRAAVPAAAPTGAPPPLLASPAPVPAPTPEPTPAPTSAPAPGGAGAGVSRTQGRM